MALGEHVTELVSGVVITKYILDLKMLTEFNWFGIRFSNWLFVSR